MTKTRGQKSLLVGAYIQTDHPIGEPGGASIVLLSPEGDRVECIVRLDFPTTNNEAEYEALIAGLDLAKATGAASVVIYCDSQVVANQVNGDYECKGERMRRYLDQVRRRVDDLKAKIIKVPRGENEQADRLAKAASAEHMIIPGNVLSFVQLSPLIDSGDTQEIGSGSNWTTPLVSYLKNGVLPDGKEAARKLKVQAARFVLIKDVLYKRSFSHPYLRCLGTEEADYVMREIHERICENHSASRSLVHKLVRARYYWPTMQKDAEAYVKSCDKCQRFNNFIKYGIPRVLVSDNGKQFDNNAFRDFCSELGIKNHYSSPAHPQANEQVEVTSRSLLKIIKTRLEKAKGIWPDELPSVLWAYRTTARTPTGETSFHLAYGNEVVIPAEVGLTSYRVENYDMDENEKAMCLQLDLVDEVRAAAEQRLARYQNLMAKHYNTKVRHRDFQVSDLVLRKVMGAVRF
ncbi:uncharacterized protein LOC115980184 [Quercus lobata]|uniref:uncharacterized protein LOC115980184 n=1 Tax=Quercus lobata TaxID=97700 RepID=UPI0012469BED|nr:uncharacterized protein LOC115980184 [Quercus lobata]